MNDKRSTKTRILEAAVECFTRRGFKKTTLEEVASDVGLVKSAIYKYFPNKEALFGAVVNHYTGCFERAVDKALEDVNDLREQLHRLFTMGFDFQKEMVDSHNMTIDQWLEFVPPLIDQISEPHLRMIRRIASLLEKADESGQIQCAAPMDHATLLFNFSDHLFNYYLTGMIKESDCRRLLRLCVDTMLDGLRQRGPQS